MDAPTILSSLLTAVIIGVFVPYFYWKRQTERKAEIRQREEMRSLREEAEGLRQELRSSSVAIHASEIRIQELTRRIQELTRTLSDPAKVFLDHLKDVREQCDQLCHGLGEGVGRANLEVENLVQKQRKLNRDPQLLEDVVDLLRQASLTLGHRAKQIAETGVFIEGLCQEVAESRLGNIQSINQDMSNFDDLIAFIDSLCAPLTRDEKWQQRFKELPYDSDLAIDGKRAFDEIARADAKDPKRDFERWKYPPLTPLEKFNQIKKAFGQRDGFG
ncbi:hypothetical protein ACC808_07665 [Rhizobium ruizarguesonis]